MIHSLSANVSAAHLAQLRQPGMAEGPGEAEHDGDGDDRRIAMQAAGASTAASVNKLADHLGNRVNTFA